MRKHSGIQTEIDASYLYDKLAAHEDDPVIKDVYQQMSRIEQGHAETFTKHNNLSVLKAKPSIRARILNLIGKWFGYDYVLGVLMETEKSIANALVVAKEKHQKAITGSEVSHVNILRSILEKQPGVSGKHLSKFERKHRTIGGNAIRAAVLGGNDGLVSNFSLVMGVAGAAQQNGSVLLAGIAGLLAGALSMALGEWISVKSSQELYEKQMKVEMLELQTDPEAEIKELALIYIAKGIAATEAYEIAKDLMSDKEKAHEVLIKEELGINAEELKGSAFEAAMYSFVLFSIGAFIPVLPFLLMSETKAILVSVLSSAAGLFLIGSAITLFTGKSIWFSGLRQVMFGLAAAAVTFSIGKLIGGTVAA